MPPPPKDPSTRRRRNKTSTARTLHAVPDTPTPALATVRQWNDETLAWWADLWSSPMAPEYDDSDIHGLLLLAVLVDEFWSEPSRELAAEIRLQRQCYGLTPIDRRRLQWEIERGEEAEEKRQTRRATPKRQPAGKDPRKALA